MNSINVPNWLRWLLILPASLGAALAGGLVIKVMMAFAWPMEPTRYSQLLTDAVQAVAYGSLFVAAGTYTAPPSRPDLLPIILAGVFVFLSGILAASALTRLDWLALSIFAIGAGAAIATAVQLQPPRVLP